MISLDPIAYFHSTSNEKADVPRQGSLSTDHLGVIRFLPGKNFEQAIEDLEGMEKIWVLFWMHQVSHWKAKVQPPREVTKKSVFATRSPHRPNPIGLSCVTLIAVRGRELEIKDHDLLDKTPILDIKPYLAYADSFPDVKSGWLDLLSDISSNTICWEALPLLQMDYLKEEWQVDLYSKIESRLKYFMIPSSSNRVSFLGEEYNLLAYKEWRILFQKKALNIVILAIFSGYKESEVNGIPLHSKFSGKFNSFFSEMFIGNGFALYLKSKLN